MMVKYQIYLGGEGKQQRQSEKGEKEALRNKLTSRLGAVKGASGEESGEGGDSHQ